MQNGTVTNDIGRAVKEAVSQTVLFQKDKTAIVHVPLGKVWVFNISSPFVFLLIFFVKKLFMCLVLLFPYTRCMIYILFQCNYSLLQVNYSEEALRENIGAFMNALLLAKPAGLKKSEYTYDASIFEPSLVLLQ